jgi:hypothetical protein
MRWIGTILNFFLPGLGYLVAGPGPKRLTGLPMAAAMAILTHVELGLQTAAPALYWPMFGAVFLFNTAFAVDTWQTLGKELPAKT